MLKFRHHRYKTPRQHKKDKMWRIIELGREVAKLEAERKSVEEYKKEIAEYREQLDRSHEEYWQERTAKERARAELALLEYTWKKDDMQMKPKG